jgi:hypothetical protein
MDTDDRTLRELRDAPKPAPLAVGPQADGYVGRLTLPSGLATQLSADSEPLPRPVAVYYLYGDERRAVRRFVAENEALVERGLARDPTGFPAAWDDVLRTLLREEWAFSRREAE